MNGRQLFLLESPDITQSPCDACSSGFVHFRFPSLLLFTTKRGSLFFSLVVLVLANMLSPCILASLTTTNGKKWIRNDKKLQNNFQQNFLGGFSTNHSSSTVHNMPWFFNWDVTNLKRQSLKKIQRLPLLIMTMCYQAAFTEKTLSERNSHFPDFVS